MNFDSTNGLNYDNIFYQSCYSNKIENFENIPTLTSTDLNYKCTESYEIKGNLLNNFNNISNCDCKTNCKTDPGCVGFNYNNLSNTCTTFSDVSSLTEPNNSNTLCIRKISGTKCSIPNAKIPLPEMAESVTNTNTPTIILHLLCI